LLAGKEFQFLARLRTPAGWRENSLTTGASLIDIAAEALNRLQVPKRDSTATESRKGESTAKAAKMSSRPKGRKLA